MGKAIVFHVFIDQVSASSINATSSKGDKIFMSNIGKCSYFSHKLSLTSHRFYFNWKHFYSHEWPISNPTLQSETKQSY